MIGDIRALHFSPLSPLSHSGDPILAHADTFSTFNLTGVTLQTGSASGTVTFDITTGQVTSANVLVNNGVSNFTFNTLSGLTIPTGVDTFFNLVDSANDIY